VRIDCSLCGVKMLDLHFYLSATVNVKYVLHTQPIGLYNKVLVWVSRYPSLSPYLSLLDYPYHLLHLLLPFHAILSPPLAFLCLSHQPLLF
jgi:hypothetical protein